MKHNKYKILLFVTLILTLVSTHSGCKKSTIEKFPDKIVGVWNWSGECQGLFNPCASKDEVYLKNNQWFTIQGCNLNFQDNKNCILDETSPCPSQNGDISDAFSYWIDGDILVRQRYEIIFDATTPIVTDTFVIKTVKGKNLSNKVDMTIEPLNQTAANSFGRSIGDRILLEKWAYNKSFDGCVN